MLKQNLKETIAAVEKAANAADKKLMGTVAINIHHVRILIGAIRNMDEKLEDLGKDTLVEEIRALREAIGGLHTQMQIGQGYDV